MHKATLNTRERLACQEYVAAGCKSFPEAMIKAKFAKSTAKHNSSIKLAKPAIKAEIERLTAEKTEECDVQASALMARLKAIALKSGNEQASIRAAEVLGRWVGLDRPEAASGGLVIVVDGQPQAPQDAQEGPQQAQERPNALPEPLQGFAKPLPASEGQKIDPHPRAGGASCTVGSK